MPLIEKMMGGKNQNKASLSNPQNNVTENPKSEQEQSRTENASKTSVVFPGVDESHSVADFKDDPLKSPRMRMIARRAIKRWRQRTLRPHHHLHHARYATPAMVKASRFRSFAEGVFVSRELAPKEDRDMYIRYTVREMAIYTNYAFVIILLALGSRSLTRYHFVDSMLNTFTRQQLSSRNPTTLITSISVQDFWDYMRFYFPENLYRENKTTGDQFGVLYQNKLIGVPRLRQLRVKGAACEVAENFRHVRRDCFPAYEESLEDKGDENTHMWSNVASNLKDAWRYNSAGDLGGGTYRTSAATYSAAGAIQLLRKRQQDTEDILNELERLNWVDRGTRVVFLDFTIYNGNTNLFCVARIVWEFLATGGVTTSWNFQTMRLFRNLGWYEGYIVYTSQILFGIYTVYFIIQEILELMRNGPKEYFSDVYTWLDLTIIVTNIVSLVLRYMVFRKSYEVMEELKKDGDIFHDLDDLGLYRTQMKNANAFSVFFAWVKIFKYISFNRTMIQLSSTLERSARDIIGFSVMFFVVFFAYAQLGYLIFGPQVDDFHTYEDSVFTLIRLIVGEFNFRRIEETSRILGPTFFLAYVFFVFFVLLNMFLAIITDTYSVVKSEIQGQRNEFEVYDYIRRAINNLFGLFGRRNVHLDAEHAVKLAPPDGQITYAEIRKTLKRANFAEIETKAFLAKYGLKPEGALDEVDTQRILNHLMAEEQRRKSGNSVDGLRRPSSTTTMILTNPKVVSRARFVKLKHRIAKLERRVTEIIHKMTNLQETLGAKGN